MIIHITKQELKTIKNALDDYLSTKEKFTSEEEYHELANIFHKFELKYWQKVHKYTHKLHSRMLVLYDGKLYPYGEKIDGEIYPSEENIFACGEKPCDKN